MMREDELGLLIEDNFSASQLREHAAGAEWVSPVLDHLLFKAFGILPERMTYLRDGDLFAARQYNHQGKKPRYSVKSLMTGFGLEDRSFDLALFPRVFNMAGGGYAAVQEPYILVCDQEGLVEYISNTPMAKVDGVVYFSSDPRRWMMDELKRFDAGDLERFAGTILGTECCDDDVEQYESNCREIGFPFGFEIVLGNMALQDGNLYVKKNDRCERLLMRMCT